MAISPFFGENLKGLYALHSIASLIPLVISVFFFDVRQCFTCLCKKRRETDSEGSTNDSECENAQETFLQTLKRMFTHRGFMQSMFGATLAVATVNTWINTVNMNAGPSFDSPGSISLIAILFFGFGVLGAIGAGIMLDKLRDPVRLLHWIVGFAYPMAFMCMLGWFFDSGITVFVGMAMTALFGFGLFGVSIELGIEYTFKPGVDNEATVAGVMNILVNAQTAILIFLSTPENVFPTAQYIPIFWLCLFTVCVSVLAYPLPKTYRRMEHYQKTNNKVKECADMSEPKDSPQVADSQVLVNQV
jgi:galactokinase